MFTGASCCALNVAAGPGSLGPSVLQPLSAQHGGEHSSKGSGAGAHDMLFDSGEGPRWCGGTENAPLLHLGYCLQSPSGLRNVRNNTNINTTSHIPHLELMS